MDKRRMTWDQMVEEYPDMWVAIANPVFDGDHPDILEGDVIAVASDDDIGDVKAEHRGAGKGEKEPGALLQRFYLYRKQQNAGNNRAGIHDSKRNIHAHRYRAQKPDGKQQG